MCTGGAPGADTLWLKTALSKGIECTIHSFAGHHIKESEALVKKWTPEELEAIRGWLEKAGTLLKKRVPSENTYIYKLLARNAYIVQRVDAVYAMGHLVGDRVDGGTGWVWALFVTRDQGEAPFYLFDTDKEEWLEYKKEWRMCLPPSPLAFKSWAGIGSREMTDRAIQAIVEILE